RTGTPGGETAQLAWFDVQGKPIVNVAEPGPYRNVTLAPDGTQAAVVRLDIQGGSDIWIVDMLRTATRRFTFGSGISSASPIWYPDGSRIIYRANSEGVYNLYRKSTTGAEDQELMLKSAQSKIPNDLSRDGRFLLYSTLDPKQKLDLWLLPLEGDRKPTPLVAKEFDEYDGRFSADSRFVAYVSNESGRPEIYVREFSGTSVGRKWQVSTSGGSNPRWRGDGRAMFYLAADARVMQVDVNTSAGFQAVTLHALFKLPPRASSFDVTGDGKRFLVGVP